MVARKLAEILDAGIVVVTSAGNFGINPSTGKPGYAGVTSPGNAPSALTVGSFDDNGTVGRGDDKVATYSSRGPTWYDGTAKPDLLADGHHLVSDGSTKTYLYQNYPTTRIDSGHLRLSGTSMAAGVATGAIALMLEASRAANGYPVRPSLTPNAVKAIPPAQRSARAVHPRLPPGARPLRPARLSARPGLSFG